MYLLTIDQSTSATKALLFDEALGIVGRANVEHRQIHPSPGWVEHDPVEIYENLLKAVAQLLEATGVDQAEIRCLSVTNQRETTLIWDEKTGLPVYHALVWQDGRAAALLARDAFEAEKDRVMEKTGLTLSPYFSAAKAAWIVEHAGTKGSNLMFGTIDAWLVWKLTGAHVTDYSNASRTQLFNLTTLAWDEDLINLFGLARVKFPKVCPSDAVLGETTLGGLLKNPIPVAGVMGDSHAALFGQQCWDAGMGKCTFGTGNSVMMNIGTQFIPPPRGLATSLAWGMNGTVDYVLEGNINHTGDTIRWLVHEIGILPDSKSSEAYARKVPSSQGVYLVPAFTGLGAPYYRSDARAVICGLFRDANKYHITRAALEAIAYQVRDVVDLMRHSGVRFDELRVDGGPTGNGFLMQFVADMLRVKIVVNELEALSALGVACAGGLATGVFRDRAQLKALRRVRGEHAPEMPQAAADALYQGWLDAVAKAGG